MKRHSKQHSETIPYVGGKCANGVEFGGQLPLHNVNYVMRRHYEA